MLRTTAAFLVALTLFGCAGAGAGRGVNTARGERSPFAPDPALRVDACKDRDRTSARMEWEKVRATFPYHLQTIAVSPAFKSGCRALIVTEPPPSLTLHALQHVAPELLGNSEVRKHKLGHDGWTADVVFTVPPVSESAFRELVADLHGAVFGTTYRLQAIDTGARPPAFDPRVTPLDITVGPGDLNRWLLAGQGSELRPVRGGAPIPFRKLLETKAADLYIDAEHGLVSWIIPRSADIARMRALVRQFAMESDLIVGAIATHETVAIIARRRIVDPLVLQPLRFETMALLAAVDKGELAQSYERNLFAAGKTNDLRDWAPIYLSPELVDTEYGSVLNIADQFLKSWSNNGKTRYIDFNYPPPARWAFSAPIFKVANTPNLIYNWNTAHAGAAISIDDVNVFWLRRTGALNVSYIPSGGLAAGSSLPPNDEAIQALEEQGHQFFARSQVPFLIRVVQYNSLYQIFKRYGLNSSLAVSEQENEDAGRALAQATRSSLLALRKIDKQTLEMRVWGLLNTEPRSTQARIVGFFLHLSNRLKSLSASEIDLLVAKLSRSRMEARQIELPASLRKLDQALTLVHDYIGAITATGGRDLYARSIEPRSGTWIHTPSIVVSWNESPHQQAVGGHNLSAHVAEVSYDPTPGSATIYRPMWSRSPTVGPLDLDRLVLGPQGPTLGKPAAVQPPRAALGIRAEPPPPTTGWRVTDASGTARAPHDVLIAKHRDSYTVIDNDRGIRYETTTQAEAIEVAGTVRGTRQGKLVVETQNFTPDQVRGLARTMELKTGARVAGVLESPPKLVHETLDLSGARSSGAGTRMYADGAGTASVTIEVPTGTRTFKMRVQAAFKKITPERLKSSATRMEKSAQSFIDDRAVSPQRIEDLGLELREVIKEVTGCEQIEVKLQTELADVVIGEIEPPRSARGTSRHAG